MTKNTTAMLSTVDLHLLFQTWNKAGQNRTMQYFCMNYHTCTNACIQFCKVLRGSPTSRNILQGSASLQFEIWRSVPLSPRRHSYVHNGSHQPSKKNICKLQQTPAQQLAKKNICKLEHKQLLNGNIWSFLNCEWKIAHQTKNIDFPEEFRFFW